MESEHRDLPTPVNEGYLRRHTVGELRPLVGPIRLVPYDSQWPQKYEQEAKRIRNALGQHALRIEHVGSTAVPGLLAKPIIDIVLVVEESDNEQQYAPALEAAGYHLREPGWYEHRLFQEAEDGVNLHVFSQGCSEIDRMVRFRDWLRASQGDRELYAKAKQALAGQEWKYTQNYADAKSKVVEEIMSRALRDSHS